MALVSPVNLPVVTPLAPLVWLAAMLWDGDAEAALAQIGVAPPVLVTAIVSPVDGIVDRRACVPVPAPQVETVTIAGAHMTMGSNPEAQRVVAARLALQAV